MSEQDDDFKMSDTDLLEFVNACKVDPQISNQYEQRYLELYNRNSKGLKIDREQGEFLQKQLLRRGSHFAKYHRIFPDE